MLPSTPGVTILNADGEFGPAPRFSDAIRSRSIVMKDATCPALHAGLQAAEKGVPFMPLRGLIGSDVLKYRDDWKVIDSPFGNSDPIVLLPAIRPDVALIHAAMADRFNNVWIGRQHELAMMAHAAEKTVVTVEKIVDGDLLADPVLAAGALPGFYVEAVAVADRFFVKYPRDELAPHVYQLKGKALTEGGMAEESLAWWNSIGDVLVAGATSPIGWSTCCCAPTRCRASTGRRCSRPSSGANHRDPRVSAAGSPCSGRRKIREMHCSPPCAGARPTPRAVLA